MRLVVPTGDFWFAGFGTPVDLTLCLDSRLLEELEAELGGTDATTCDEDLRIGALAAGSNLWLIKRKREVLAALLGPLCSRPAQHRGRHLALVRRHLLVAAWPGTEPVSLADFGQVLDETGQAP